MNKSRYTVVVEGKDGETLLFNTATGAFAAIESQLNPEDFETELAEAGFLTELAPEEELAHQQELFDHARADNSELALSLVPTYACNYCCPYCYEPDEAKIPGKMDEQTMDAIMRFVAHVYDANPFTRLTVQWYGGDPSLALDVVERLSGEFLAWCAKHEIAYDATMLTNANVIGEAEAQLIAECGVTSVMLTIDGPEEIHNTRRVAADGSNSYQRNIQAARYLHAAGVQVMAVMNTDAVTLPLYPELRDRLLEEENISLGLSKLNDYGSTFGCPPFAKPDFDLLTHKEFFKAQADYLLGESTSAEAIRALLQPCGHFCSGQLDNYFVIDVRGDVYHCDGRVGKAQYVKFNLLDDPATWKMHEITFDATRDTQCSACSLLPICQGSCIWERVCCEKSEGAKPCHPLKTTLARYLQAWRDRIDVPVEAYTRLA